ncbi:hypothetical protein [Amycolatopsis sp. CA-230715]|uniref:hypothetical protein n=1 Tax=Amycolatopsis sp. CA-230715 TaxID=2745196 RepID=UPI001C036554|nr:hypothetical protein [Amycolatopsis sp. CA-230715]QWF85715.1 hypothetical protein HUW46_09195 [Amycolatopsis sp. CA-230715]
MSKTSQALAALTQAVLELARQQGQVRTALADLAREQRVTNLLTRSRVATDRGERAWLTAEAARRMDAPQWRAIPGPTWPWRAPEPDTSRP